MSHFCMSCDPPTGIFCPGVKSWRRRCYLSWQLTAKLHIRASVVQVIQTLMKLCHSQIFHRGTAEWLGDGGNYWVCFFGGWHERLYWVQQCRLVVNWIIARLGGKKYRTALFLLGFRDLITNLSKKIISDPTHFHFRGYELR